MNQNSLASFSTQELLDELKRRRDAEKAKKLAAKKERIKEAAAAGYSAQLVGTFQQSKAKGERILRAHAMFTDGTSVKEIAKTLGVHPTTVERYLQSKP